MICKQWGTKRNIRQKTYWYSTLNYQIYPLLFWMTNKYQLIKWVHLLFSAPEQRIYLALFQGQSTLFPLTHPFGRFFSMIGPQILRPWNCPLEKNPLEDYIVLSLCWLYTCLTWGNVYKYISLTYYIILLNWHGK